MKRQVYGLTAVLLVGVAFLVFQIFCVEPRDVGLACLHHTGPPLVCGPRAALNWVVHFYLVGTAALACGIWAIYGGRLLPAVLAVCFGVVGMIDYNISWGLLGAALGGWAWLRAPQHA